MNDGTCRECGEPMTLGPQSKYCSESCKMSARNARQRAARSARSVAACAAKRADRKPCPQCGELVERQPGKRGSVPTYCSALCKSRAASARRVADGRHAAELAESAARSAAVRAANARPCPYCGVPMEHPRRMQCGAPDCERRFNNERAAGWLRDYKERTGEPYRYKYEHEHICEACGKAWTSRDPGTRFCSGACANSVRTWVRTCERCGSQWTAKAPTARFCSPRCADADVYARSARSQVVLYTGTAPRPVIVLPPLRARWYAGFSAVGAESFIHNMPQTITCTDRCSIRLASARRRAVERSAFVENVSRWKIYERDGWRCQLCRKPVDRDKSVPHPLAPTLDHIIPLARGGTHEPANCQCAHFLCNSLKGDRGSGEQLLLIG